MVGRACFAAVFAVLLSYCPSYIMSHNPEPKPFQGYSGDEHIPVDQEDQGDAAALQLQNNGPLDHRLNGDKKGVAFGRSTSAGTLMGKPTTKPLPETTPSGIDVNKLKPVSCPEFGHDSESVVAEEPEGPALHSDTGHPANASVGNGVRRSSPTTTGRSTAGHARQARDNSDQPPISSSENAEEQGE